MRITRVTYFQREHSLRIQHIIPLVDSEAPSELKAAQEFTLRTLVVAHRQSSHHVQVHFSSHKRDPPDKVGVPQLGAVKPVLESALQVLLHENAGPTLPLLSNIVDQVEPDFDLTVFSNPDISVRPEFYDLIASLSIQASGGSVTRKTIRGNPANHFPLQSAFQQKGENHPGHDCFFFQPKLAQKFFVGNVFLGAPPVGAVMMLNIGLTHPDAQIFGDADATFHFGDDRAWARTSRAPLLTVNQGYAGEVLTELCLRFSAREVENTIRRLGLRALTIGGLRRPKVT